MRWRRVFPGNALQLRELRRWLAGLLPDRTARDDLISIAVEYAANAVVHTASGNVDGSFAAELTWHGPRAWIAIADDGGPDQSPVLDRPYGCRDRHREHGYGLTMVQELAMRTGVIGGSNGRVMWAEVLWPGEQAPPEVASEHAHEREIAAECDLREGFGEFLSWYGRETLQRWAIPNAAGLVTAPSPADLAGALGRARQVRLADKP